MKTFQVIEEDISNLEFIRSLAEAHESIAALYMRRIKQNVLESRAFFEGLRRIYMDVLSAHEKEITQERQNQLATHKEVAVLLSVNTGLYGNIVHATMQLFVKYVADTKPDIVIIGERGKRLFEQLLPEVPYTFFSTTDTSITINHIGDLAEFLAKYKSVHVFYGKFESYISQVPTHTVLGDVQVFASTSVSTVEAKIPTLYMFEPSLKDIVQFFRTEIFTSLLQQTVQESQLSKLAARMVLLDSATIRAQKILKNAVFLRQKLFHQKQNKKQLETVTHRLAMGI